MASAINERRQEQRFEGIYAEYAIIQSVNESDRANFKGSFLRNFSNFGASLFIHDKPPPNVLIKLRLYEPHSARPIEVTGGVVWLERSSETPLLRERFNVGLKFLNLEDDIRHRLEMMVQYFESEKNRAYTISSLIP